MHFFIWYRKNRRKVEFFEELYDTKIEGVKLFKKYTGPDHHIAKKQDG